MFPSKFYSNDSLPSLQNSFSSINSVSSLNYGPILNMELYPRRRQTEFYYEPQPMEEYQSRASEHPRDKLQKSEHPQDKLQKATSSQLQSMSEQTPKMRIHPPRNSDMRVLRNSYFS